LIGEVLSFDFTADGNRLFVLGASGLETFDTATGRSLLLVKFGLSGEWIALRPSGEVLASPGVSDQFQSVGSGGNSQTVDDAFLAGHRRAGDKQATFFQ
jgi:hypothetical protein